MSIEFTPVEDFWSDETGSQYLAGMHYFARSPELQALVREWESAGRVRLEQSASRVQGKGG